MTIFLPWLLTLILGHFLQYLLPRDIQALKCNYFLTFFQSILLSSLFFLLLSLTLRPWLSLILSMAMLALLLIINQAKYKALIEPLVFSDWYLYIQVISHPRLFLPFLNLTLSIGALTLGLLILITTLWLESCLVIYYLPISIFSLTLHFILLNFLSRKIKLGFNIIEDVKSLGFFNSLAIYALQASSKRNKNKFQFILHNNIYCMKPVRASKINTDIIVIQSESFFDARRLINTINSSLYYNFDQIKAASLLTGKLHVPAWGANTLRSEFAFLSRISNESLNYYRFNPYQYLQNTPINSLVSFLKKNNYRCIALHPNHASFFKRDKVFPHLGFDEFIDIKAFDPTKTLGPYISDQAVYEKITEILTHRLDERPIFIFAITMENHGPLHLEKLAEQDIQSLYVGRPPKQHHDLSVYLKHIANADEMLLDLTSYLKHSKQETVLCWYGDHVPSMPEVYKELDFNDGRTDYLIWHNKAQALLCREQDILIEDLGFSILEIAGFKGFELTSNTQTKKNSDAGVEIISYHKD